MNPNLSSDLRCGHREACFSTLPLKPRKKCPSQKRANVSALVVVCLDLVLESSRRGATTRRGLTLTPEHWRRGGRVDRTTTPQSAARACRHARKACVWHGRLCAREPRRVVWDQVCCPAK